MTTYDLLVAVLVVLYGYDLYELLLSFLLKYSSMYGMLYRYNQIYLLSMWGMTNRPIIENWMKYFKCKKCWEVKPLNKSYFYVNMNTRLWFISKCISCVKKEVENKPKVKYITRAELEEENKKLKKYYDRDKEELMESCYSLAKENEKLKSDLSECECSFWFENDEVWYRKREYKRLKKWIKDHCNGYWNLFPEDEMKRQWKKADKKRK